MRPFLLAFLLAASLMTLVACQVVAEEASPVGDASVEESSLANEKSETLEGESAADVSALRDRFQYFGIYGGQGASNDAQPSSEGEDTPFAVSVEDGVMFVEGRGHGMIDLPPEFSFCLVHAEYAQEGRFLIRTVDILLNILDLLVNVDGPYEGTTTTCKTPGSPLYLEVEAAGSWKLTLVPLSEAHVAESGENFEGDDVVAIFPKDADSITLEVAGAARFLAYAVNAEGMVQFPRETGSFTVRVPNEKFHMLIVSTDGEWHVRW